MRDQPSSAGQVLVLGDELNALAAALIDLHAGVPTLDERELGKVAVYRNAVVESLSDLAAVVAGGGDRRRVIGSVDDLQVAPTAFFVRAMRNYPRLPADDISPSDAFSGGSLGRTASTWRLAARHALAAAHVALSQTRLPTLPGERAGVLVDLACLAQAATSLDAGLAHEFGNSDDRRQADLARAARVGMAVVCREVRRQNDSATGAEAWMSAEQPRSVHPLVVRDERDWLPAMSRLRRLLEVTEGQLDSRSLAAVIQAQARVAFRMHELLAVHARSEPARHADVVVAHSVAQLELAHLLADAYRATGKVASPFRGDRRAVTQAAEMHRSVDGASLARPPSTDVLASLGSKQLRVVVALERSVGTGFAAGKLLVPGWDDESGAKAWTLASRSEHEPALLRRLRATHERPWTAFVDSDPRTALAQQELVRTRLAHIVR